MLLPLEEGFCMAHGLWFSEINAKKLLAENLAALQGVDK